ASLRRRSERFRGRGWKVDRGTQRAPPPLRPTVGNPLVRPAQRDVRIVGTGGGWKRCGGLRTIAEEAGDAADRRRVPAVITTPRSGADHGADQIVGVRIA